MRFKLIAATSTIAIALASGACGAEINQAGAKQVEESLTKLLPRSVAKDRVVTVNPAGTRYEIIYDLAKLLKKLDPGSLTITGLTPWSMFATPLDTGLWSVEGNNSLNVSGSFKAPGQPKADFTYAIDAFVVSGMFDPAISYFRSGDFSTKAVNFSSKSEAEELNAGFDGMKYKVASSEGAAAGTTNFATSGSATGFIERIKSGEVPPVEIRADAFDFAAAVNGLPANKVRDIILFVIDHADEKKLAASDSNKLKAMLRDAFPLLTSFNETIGLNNLTVSSAAGSGGAKNVGYEVTLDGPTDATRFGIGVTAEQISFASPVVPAAYSAFLPRELQLKFAIADMDFAAFGDEFLKVDFTGGAASEDSGKKAAERLFKGGELVMDFPKISAVSSVYDAEVSGKIRGRIDSSKDYSMDATVLARDLDKTIAAVQELAKTNADLNQVSFGLMMAKGFAKTDPDGRQRWDISVAKNGSVTINGQVIKGAD
ncbi:hypothetical protein [Rhizobium mesoamericanum]|uniref:Uncharacterized protein n=1 Tax=Rhizobium mesoamericanum STM3625 TaxID=1211777 RepID=K0PS05_9HYPH|nr:hypothetical protein [Rhizobium mesoamericanum]CCM76618.1 conserved exported hypothetical protein [Rhizobium mesoamericanum STM3625]